MTLGRSAAFLIPDLSVIRLFDSVCKIDLHHSGGLFSRPAVADGGLAILTELTAMMQTLKVAVTASERKWGPTVPELIAEETCETIPEVLSEGQSLRLGGAG
jgi:hypothetical protein